LVIFRRRGLVLGLVAVAVLSAAAPAAAEETIKVRSQTA
jgi:hypothetical protein